MLSRACCAGSALYCPIVQFRVIGRVWKPKFNVSLKAGRGLLHSSYFSWPRPLPLTGPPQSGVSYIERWSDSNPSSHHRESNNSTNGTAALANSEHMTAWPHDYWHATLRWSMCRSLLAANHKNGFTTQPWSACRWPERALGLKGVHRFGS